MNLNRCPQTCVSLLLAISLCAQTVLAGVGSCGGCERTATPQVAACCQGKPAVEVERPLTCCRSRVACACCSSGADVCRRDAVQCSCGGNLPVPAAPTDSQNQLGDAMKLPAAPAVASLRPQTASVCTAAERYPAAYHCGPRVRHCIWQT